MLDKIINITKNNYIFNSLVFLTHHNLNMS